MSDEETAAWAYRAGLAEGELHIARKVIEAARILVNAPHNSPNGAGIGRARIREAIEEYDKVRNDDPSN